MARSSEQPAGPLRRVEVGRQCALNHPGHELLDIQRGAVGGVEDELERRLAEACEEQAARTVRAYCPVSVGGARLLKSAARWSFLRSLTVTVTG